MSKAMKFKLNRSGVGELLHKCGRQICVPKARQIAAAAGEGYEADAAVYSSRVVGEVRAMTYSAMLDDLNNNTLLKTMRGMAHD